MDLNALYLRRKFWLDDFFKGSPIGKPYKEIEFLSEHTMSDCQEIRDRKLKDILTFACKNSAFFKDIASDKLENFPVMNKVKYIANYDSVRVNDEDIPYQVGKVHIQSTSGSTGTPFKVPQDTAKRQRRVAELKYFGKIVGFNTHEKLIHLRTWNKWQAKTPKQIKRENIIPFDISDMGGVKIKQLCDMIVSEKTVCLRGYASTFEVISNYLIEHPMRFPTLKVCIAGSEALHDDVRKKVKENMHCEIISQYADEECGILAQERIPTKDSDNVMYFNYSGYFLEVLKLDEDKPADYGELGRIVITDFHNHAFPMIRYDTGDVAILARPNEFSNGYPVVEKLFGRRMDICYNTKGQAFSPMAIGRIMKHFENVAQWQFIQKAEKEYVLNIVMNSKSDITEYLKPAMNELLDIIGRDADIKIIEKDGIPVLASGKRKPVVNEWKEKK